MTRVELKITGATYEKTTTITTPAESPLLPLIELLTQTLQQYRSEIEQRCKEFTDLWQTLRPYFEDTDTPPQSPRERLFNTDCARCAFMAWTPGTCTCAQLCGHPACKHASRGPEEAILASIRREGEDWIASHLLADQRPFGTFAIEAGYVVVGEGHALDILLNLVLPNWRKVIAAKLGVASPTDGGGTSPMPVP